MVDDTKKSKNVPPPPPPEPEPEVAEIKDPWVDFRENLVPRRPGRGL